MNSYHLTTEGKRAVDKIILLLKKTEFVPAINQILEIIQDLSSKNQTAQIQELVDAISKDIGLTSKIVIAANTVHFNHTGQRIQTITEAILQIGLCEVRSLVVTLLFLAPLQDPLKGEEIRNISSIALISGLISEKIQLLSPLKSREQVLICATLRYYGRLLITNFLTDEIGPTPDFKDHDELDDYYRQKIGIIPIELGYHVAKSMNLSSSILKSMDSLQDNSVQSYLNDPDGVYLIIASFSMFLCNILESHPIDPITVDEKFNALALRYQEVLHVSGKIIKDILLDTQKDLENFQTLYNLPPFQTDFIDRLNCINSGTSYLMVHPSHRKPKSVTDTFLLGLQEITEMLTSENTTSIQLIHKIVRTVYDALHLRNCVLLMSSEKEGHYCAQDAMGENAFEFRTEFKINLDGKDIFSACLLRGDDVLIQNLNESKISHHLPPWYKAINITGTAFLLPIKDHEKVIGVLYGDQREIGSIHFTPDVSRNLKALRNQIRITRKLFPLSTPS